MACLLILLMCCCFDDMFTCINNVVVLMACLLILLMCCCFDLSVSRPVFKLFVDNKLEQEVAGLEGWRVHQSDVSFMISGLTLGGSPSVQTDNFSGCIKDFIVQEK